jgi:cytochrome c
MNKKSVFVSAGIASLLLLTSSSVFAADGAELYKAKLCNTCHGADGKTPLLPTYPKLAGQNAEYLIQQAKDIRDGKRTNGLTSAMKPLVAQVKDDELKAISQWLASQK